jgi:hypothetical protein
VGLFAKYANTRCSKWIAVNENLFSQEI